MEKIIIGQIVKTIGLKGMLKILPITKTVNRFKNLKKIYIQDYEQKFELESSNPAGTFANIKLKNYDTIESVECFKGKYISVDRCDAIKLEKDEYFIQDLLDCELYYYDGKLLGKIIDVDNFGANDIIYFKSIKEEIPFAYIDGIFDSVDLQNKKIIVSKKFDEVYLECE